MKDALGGRATAEVTSVNFVEGWCVGGGGKGGACERMSAGEQRWLQT